MGLAGHTNCLFCFSRVFQPSWYIGPLTESH